jgi:hypothetical protein
MIFVKEALFSVTAAAWIVGLVNQFGSWPMTATYVTISLGTVTVTFADRLVLRFAPRRKRGR